jgi:hypothetical protein
MAEDNAFITMYIINDRPNTCPFCGARTLEIGSFYHTKARYGVDICLDKWCGRLLMFCVDEEFDRHMHIN